jgi:small subunit ribosomal protein S14|uniref:Small ribosomal subunit protein uS14c n=1 Tax=Thorea hispida TaxID=202687 RepID=A0A1C9CAA0_9FLOR|nr:ribosomal protein S14 [Thorea hispida]AOM65297.1 ribosomal protein S14 [Thorea hispida]ARX95859.1 30S ribosomal protein S14 [Thorea hispida]UNJ79144.1 ribosomal protein S14 [Thorea hispida]
MAKKSSIQKEMKKGKLIEKYNKKRLEIKQQIKSVNNFKQQIYLQKQLQTLPRNSSKIRLRNRCWLTGRSRGFYRHFGISRHVLRELSHQCLLPGVRKSSW